MKARVQIRTSSTILTDLLAQFLGADEELTVIATDNNDRIPFADNADIALIDYELYLKYIRPTTPDAKAAKHLARLVLLVDEAIPETLFERIPDGVHGLVTTSFSANRLRNVVKIVAAGETYIPLEVLNGEATHHRGAGISFSRQERAVLRELASGRSNNDISASLRMALPTVKMHVSSILKKTGCRNRSQVAIMVREDKLLATGRA